MQELIDLTKILEVGDEIYDIDNNLPKSLIF